MKQEFVDLAKYRIEKARDLKDLREKLKNFRDLVNTIDGLSINTKPYGVRKIKGFDKTFRIRFMSYRIIYDIYDKDKKIIILRITRRDKFIYKFI